MRDEERVRASRRGYAIAVAALLGLTAPLAAQQESPPERECECGRWRVEAPVRSFGGTFFQPGGELTALRTSGRARLGIELDMEAGAPAAGAVVRRVMPGTPADDAGLRAGDEIMALDGTGLLRALPSGEPDVEEGESAPARRLIALMEDVEPGDTVRLEVLREGERMDVAVVTDEGGFFFGRTMRVLGPEMESTLRQLPRTLEFAMAGAGLGGPAGLRAVDLNEDLAPYFDVEAGVLVLERSDDSPFDVRGGDVIVAVDGREVRSASHLFRIMRSYEPDETIGLEVVRQGSRITVEGRQR